MKPAVPGCEGGYGIGEETRRPEDQAHLPIHLRAFKKGNKYDHEEEYIQIVLSIQYQKGHQEYANKRKEEYRKVLVQKDVMIVRYITTATIPNSEKELAINVQHQLPAAASSLQQNQSPDPIVPWLRFPMISIRFCWILL